MRLMLTALVLVLAASTADAQLFPRRGQSVPQQNCPGGVCPAPSAPFSATPFAAPQNCPGGICPTAGAPSGAVYADPGPAPSANHELHLVGGRLVWVAKPAAVPRVMEAPPGVPAPKFVESPSSARDKHGRMFYRHIVDRSYRGLVDRGIAPDKARKLVESLSHESIDVYGDHVGISGKIGDGGLLQWLIDHQEQIAALIKLIISLLALA